MTGSHALPGRPRSAGRPARTPDLAAALAARLTARDRWLLRMLLEHRVLTTGQLADLTFGTAYLAAKRMRALYELRAVDRFRPLAPVGSSPMHFILDAAGAAVLAAEDGVTPDELGYRRDRAMAIALSPRLAHDTGANGFFTSLAAAARTSGGQSELECWWSERRCAAAWGECARPDGYGRWREQDAVTDFFLEYDTGTEPLTRVIAKLAGYAALAGRTRISTPVLFWLPSARRETSLRARIAGPPPAGVRDAVTAAQIPGVPVFTASPESEGPAGASWLPAGSRGPRIRLALIAPRRAAEGPDTGRSSTAPLAPPGGLAWHPPAPASPVRHDLAGKEAADE